MTTFYHDRQRQLLVYDTPDVETITRYVQEARVIGPTYVAVPCKLPNLQLLRWLGFPVVPLMNYEYDWPHGPQIDAPFRAQIITANFLAVHPRAFVLSEMRTGKTLSLLWGADFVMKQYPPGECRAIICCQLSIMRRVWANAIWQHFLGRRTYGVLHGTQEQRLKVLAQPHDFYLLNHDGVSIGGKMDNRGRFTPDGFSAALAARTDIKISILDESSALKHGGTLRHRATSAVLKNRPYMWCATGTPTPNGPQDAYAQSQLVNNAFGESFRSYRARTMYQLGQFRWVPMRGAKEEALKLLSPAIRFRMVDCVDVPPKLPPQLVDVELSAEQAKAHKELRATAMLMVQGGAITAANEAVLRSKLIQIACGVVYENRDDERIEHCVGCPKRVSAMYEIIEQAGDKIIILTTLTSILTMLHKELTKTVTVEGTKQPQYRVGLIYGKVTPKKRDELIGQFQEGDLQILLADPGVMAHGLDLSQARVLLWFNLPEKTEQYLQANERIRGPNQKYPTLIAHLAATPTEREIFRRLEANESLQGAMLSLIKGDDNGRLYGRAAGAAPPGYQGSFGSLGGSIQNTSAAV